MGRTFFTILFVFSFAAFCVTLGKTLNADAGTEQDLVSIVAPPGITVRAAALMVPRRIEIPVLGVDADVEQVGITKSGRMATHESFSTAAWYKYGPAPGEEGSAVIAGHLDNALGMPGVFSSLKDLRPGDKIVVINTNREELHFVVESAEVLAPDADTANIFATDGPPRLVLITCEGEWDQEHKQYTGRRAIYAVLAE